MPVPVATPAGQGCAQGTASNTAATGGAAVLFNPSAHMMPTPTIGFPQPERGFEPSVGALPTAPPVAGMPNAFQPHMGGQGAPLAGASMPMAVPNARHGTHTQLGADPMID